MDGEGIWVQSTGNCEAEAPLGNGKALTGTFWSPHNGIQTCSGLTHLPVRK